MTVRKKLAPIRFQPKMLPKIWGARRLQSVLGKRLPGKSKFGESWEVSAHPGDETPILQPKWLAGRTIPQLAASDLASDVFGAHADAVRTRGFPLLYKFIDADDVLSVQVHPDDAYARAHENDNGKTECWVVIDARSDSILYKGFKPGTDMGKFDAYLAQNRLEECLNSFPVSAGDVVFIPARTVHAIGAGILLAEIQQSSDVTYRVYDWGRLGDDGKPRPLHVRQAREVMDFSPPAENTSAPKTLETFPGGRRELLASCPYFNLERLILGDEQSMSSRSVDEPSPVPLPSAGNGSFSILSVLDGEATLVHNRAKTKAGKGDSFLIPAALEQVSVSSSHAVVLNAYLPF